MVMIGLGNVDIDYNDVTSLWEALVHVANTTLVNVANHYSWYERLGLPCHFNLK